MARSFPAQTMGQVSVQQKVRKPLSGGKGFVTTHYNWNLNQAMRNGAITLNDDGKITGILMEDIEIVLPRELERVDVFASNLWTEQEKRVGHELQG